MRRSALLLLLLVGWSVSAFCERSGIGAELRKLGEPDLSTALSYFEGELPASATAAAARFLAAAPLTRGESTGAMKLYIAMRSRLEPRLGPAFVSALSSSDPVVRIYALSFLDVLRTPVPVSILFRLAAYDSDEKVSALAARMLGFYGMKGMGATLRGSFSSLPPRRAADLLFRLAATSTIKPETAERAVALLAEPSAHALAALASCRSQKLFEIASHPRWSGELHNPWLWSLLSEADPAKAVSLFSSSILPSAENSELPAYAERLSAAAAGAPEKALKLASALERSSPRAALVLLRALPHPDAVKRAEAVVRKADRVIDRLSYAYYLLEMGDYAFADTLAGWLSSREFSSSPRRLVWCANLLSYYRRRKEALPVLNKALAASTSLTGRAAAVAAIIRLDPNAAAPVLEKLVAEFPAEWKKRWNGDLKADYASSGLPSLVRSVRTLSAAAAELPSSRGLPLLKRILDTTGPFFASDVLSAVSRWPGDAAVVEWLHSLLDGPFLTSLAAVNALAFAGDEKSYEILLQKAASSPSLEFKLAALSAAASLAVVDEPRGRMGAEDRIAALRALLPSAVSPPRERGGRLLGSAGPASRLISRAAGLTGAKSGPAMRFLVLRTLQRLLSSPFTRVWDYHPYFHLHDPASVLTSAWKAAGGSKP